MRRLVCLAVATLLVPAAVVVPSSLPTSSAAAEPVPIQLTVRTDDMVDPIAIGNATPALSWRVTDAATNNLTQMAYEVRVASTEAALSAGDADLWETGEVASSEQRLTYDGQPLGSRDRIHWQVRVTLSDGSRSAWSAPATAEIGLLDQSDWTADWITDPAWRGAATEADLHPVKVSVPQTTARYVRLNVTEMGLPVYENNRNEWFVQLAEVTIRNGDGPNLATGATVSASSDLGNYGWKASNLVDGLLTSDDGNARGWTTWGPQLSATGGVPHVVTLDLGSAKTFDSVSLFPRTDKVAASGGTPSFPSDYSLLAGDDPSSLSSIATVEDQVAPQLPGSAAMPVLASDFEVDPGKEIAQARLYAAGVGIFVPSVNGASITDNVLEPGYTDYAEKVEYSGYDVTEVLEPGTNALGIELGTGMAWAGSQDGKYAKLTSTISRPRALAQLEISYTDGSSDVVTTDGSWRSTEGPTTMAQWYGGEEYDARREIDGWNEPGADRSEWSAAAEVTPPGESTQLVARDAPPLEIVDTMESKARTTPAAGVEVHDLGTNVAGWPEITIDAPAGTEVQIWIGELLQNGRVSQNNGTTGVPIYDTFTSDGSVATWHPRFVYHGMQYLEIRGVTADTTISGVKAHVIRAANEQVGTFDTSDATVDAVHRLVDRAIQGNMYSVLTDCPDREKLGWMEQNHLVFGTIMRNYDVSAYARSIVQKIADAQLDNGMVPSIAPEYAVFGGGFRDDPNWGSAIVLMPWAMYENYGDVQTLSKFWPDMVQYVDYLDSKASGDLVNYPSGLGDWAEQLSGGARTPINLVANFGYYRAVDGMADIAEVIGRAEDAAAYRAQAERIRNAFRSAYYNASTKTVGNGSQASHAFALDIGAIPAADQQAVFDKLIASIEANNTHLNVGEIALPSVYRVLSAYGRDDLVHLLTVQPTKPSFGFFVQNGATSLPEYWDDTTGSRNHFMLGAIDEWFSKHLVGIDQAADSVAFEEVVFTPSIVNDMTHAEGGYETPYGHVASAWELDGQGRVTMSVEVPVGSTAVVNVPVPEGAADDFVPAHAADATYTGRNDLPNGTYATFEVGSGAWTFGPEAEPEPTEPPTTVPPTTVPPTTVPPTTVPPTTTPTPVAEPKVRVRSKVRAGKAIMIRGREFSVTKVRITFGGKKLAVVKVEDDRFKVSRVVPKGMKGRKVLRVLDRKGEVLVQAKVRVLKRKAS